VRVEPCAARGFREWRKPGQREASEHRLDALEARLLGPAGLLLLQLLDALLSERERERERWEKVSR